MGSSLNTSNPAGTEVTCNDTIDNDCDGLIDLNDPDCPRCGDGTKDVSLGEECDPGPDVAGDCCDSNCHLIKVGETGFECRAANGTCDVAENCSAATESNYTCPTDAT